MFVLKLLLLLSHWVSVVASRSLLDFYYYGRFSFEPAELVDLFIVFGGVLNIVIVCVNFLLPFLDVTRFSMQRFFFLQS